MPKRPQRPCAMHGWILVDAEHPCAECAKQAGQPSLKPLPVDTRPSAAKRGYGSKWQRYREEFFSVPRICACGCGQRATLSNGDIDHKIAVSGPKDLLFWKRSNHQAMIHSHHSRKTAKENRISPRRGRGM